MAGGRGASGRSRAEQQESYSQRQDHELQALEAIYGSDFQDLRPDARGRVGTWLVWPGVLQFRTQPDASRLGRPLDPAGFSSLQSHHPHLLMKGSTWAVKSLFPRSAPLLAELLVPADIP